MQRYILTERGKWIVAMLAVVLIVLPLSIFVVNALSHHNSQNEPYNGLNDVHQTENGTVLPGLSDGLDVDAGVFKFLYTPGSQNTLGEDIIALIGDLLTSPKNTDDAKIAVEIPQLADEDAIMLTVAVSDAFIANDVPLSRITFYVYITEPDMESYELTIRIG